MHREPLLALHQTHSGSFTGVPCQRDMYHRMFRSRMAACFESRSEASVRNSVRSCDLVECFVGVGSEVSSREVGSDASPGSPRSMEDTSSTQHQVSHSTSVCPLVVGRAVPSPGPSQSGRHALNWASELLVLQVATEDERKRSSERPDLDLDTKVAVFLLSLLGVCCGFGYAAVWAHLRCYYTAVFPGILGLLCTIGAVHLRCTRSATLAAPFLGYGTALAGLGAYWSMGGNVASLALVVWAFAGIQMAIITTRRITPAFAAHLVALVLMVTLTILESVLGAGSFTPQECHIPPDWQIWLHLSNTALPCTIPTVCLVFIIQKMRKEARYLEESQAKAVAVAQKIADFDLEGLPDASPDATVHLLLQIAGNLRQYQPYLPPHLLAFNRISSDAVPAPNQGDSKAAGPCALTHVLKSARGKQRNALEAVPRNLNLRPRGHSLALDSCTGTLLYVRLPGLQLLTQSAGAEALAKLQSISDVLMEAVVRFVTQTRGVVQTLRHDECLASWGLFQKCVLHANKALTAAVAIRDYFKDHSNDFSTATKISMGVWSGPLVCSTVGTSELKSFSCIGPGVTKVSSLGHLLSAQPSDAVCSCGHVGASPRGSPIVLTAVSVCWRAASP